MSTTIVHGWTEESREQVRAAGYGHGLPTKDDPFEVARKLFTAGLNVAVVHQRDDVVIFVDTRRFTPDMNSRNRSRPRIGGLR